LFHSLSYPVLFRFLSDDPYTPEKIVLPVSQQQVSHKQNEEKCRRYKELLIVLGVHHGVNLTLLHPANVIINLSQSDACVAGPDIPSARYRCNLLQTFLVKLRNNCISLTVFKI